jgi:hypothetical protein
MHHGGRHCTAQLGLDRPDSVDVPVILAALGPRMLEVAGRLAAGTFTWMTGPVTLARHTVRRFLPPLPPPLLPLPPPLPPPNDRRASTQRARRAAVGCAFWTYSKRWCSRLTW